MADTATPPAVAIAGQLPAQLGPAPVEAARNAFIVGLQITAGLSALGSIGLAAVVLTMLRQVRTSSEPPTEVELAGAGTSST